MMKDRNGPLTLARGPRASRVSKLEDRTGVLDARGRPSRLVLRVPSDIGCDEQRQAVGAHHNIPVTIHRFEMLVLVGLTHDRCAGRVELNTVHRAVLQARHQE